MGSGTAPRRVAGPPRMRGQSPSRKQSGERKWELPGTGGCGRGCSGVRSAAAGGGLGGISVCRGSDEDSSSGLSARKLVSEGLVLALV